MTADLLLGTLVFAGLGLPGWFAARAWQQPAPALSGFLSGCAALVALVLVLETCGVGLTSLSLGLGWALFSALAVGLGSWGAVSLRPSGSNAPGRSRSAPLQNENPRPALREHWPLLLALVPMVAVAAYRACAQPLFGIDTIFRWNYLAEQMLARGTLGFYPPVSPADYEVYSWPDGIAPVVSSLYFAAYSLAGAARPLLTAPGVIGQLVLLGIAVWTLARREASERAAFASVALLALSPVVAWATVMGQETGVVAIAVAALLIYLPREPSAATPPAMILAGVAAGMAALAREYGLVFPLLGLSLCAARRLGWRSSVTFAFTVLVVTAPWYVRNWARTGNPLFNHALGELFPVNLAQHWLEQSFQTEFGWHNLPAGAARIVLLHVGALLVLGTIAAAVHFRSKRAVIVTALVVIGLWILSVRHTAAGFTYSLRVLNPALALAAVLGGAWVARWLTTPSRIAIAGAVLALLAMEASLRALTLPVNVYQLPPRAWLEAGGAVHAYHERPVYGEIARRTQGSRVLVLGPNALLTRAGARTVPLWSPEVIFIFDHRVPAAEVARRLRALDIGFVVLNRGPVNERFLARSPYLRDPGETLRPLWSDPDTILLAITPGR